VIRRIAARVLPPLIAAVVVVVIWEIVLRVGHPGPLVLPTPGDVLRALHEDAGALARAALVTGEEALAGFVCGTLAGLALAIATSELASVRRGLYPLLVTTQAIPPIALATPLAIWLGYGLWPKVIVAALLVFFPVFVNAHAGLTHLEPGLERLLRSLGASRWQILRVARLPSALPLVLAALRLGATYAVIGAVFGEWVGADDGLGIYLLEANARLQTDRVLAAVLVLAALGLIAFGLVAAAEYALTPWRRRSTRRRFRKTAPGPV
jgi:ABC-type nitrate/sulfonate/bicarbonate transport system permease component